MEIHGPSPFTSVVGFSPWRVYPDLMHISDCAILPDCISSLLVECATVMPHAGESRDEFLRRLYNNYCGWCRQMKITSGEQCNPKLFSFKILKSDSTSYPGVSQKFLKAVAARFMVYWACTLANTLHCRVQTERSRNLGILRV